METYVLKFSACLLIFWLVYILVLERQKMHRFKRFYLLGSFVVALIIPLLTITYYIEPIAQNLEVASVYIPIESSLVEIPVEETPVISLKSILWFIYGLGVLLFGIRFIVNLAKLYRNISENESIASRSFIYVLLKEYRIPHSFFKYIFLNQAKFENDTIPKEVLLHEETHAKQLHSLDVIILELLQIVFWFHPLIYVLKHHVKLNHEFLADQAVLNDGIEPKTYQNILLQFSSNTQDYQLSSAINYSSFKKRFTVMKTQTSKTKIWLSTLLLLPIIAILFYSFAEKKYVEKQDTAIVDAITQELEAAETLKMKYVNGAPEKLMQEYRDFISEFRKTNIIYLERYERAIIIYDQLMSPKQRASVEKYPERKIPELNLSKTKPRQPSLTQFEAFKNAKEYAIWIDGKHVSNEVLNDYSVNDFIHVTGSLVHKNARSKKFPQPNQYHLYTKAGFKSTYQDSQLKRYQEAINTYSNTISKYLKGSQTDNSELKILKAQADKIYKTFTKEDLETHNILPAPPVPAEKRFNQPQSKNKKSKGGPNGDYQTQDYNPSFLEYIIEMEQLGASFYLDDKKITVEKAKSIANNNKGKRTEMTTQKDAEGNYMVKLSSSTKNNHYARSIELKILNHNSYLIDGIKATKKTFINVFNQLHQDITPEVRNKIMNIHVSSSRGISNKEVWFIYNSLQDYGFYRIVTPAQEINRAKGNTPFAIENISSTQQKATKQQIAAYNKLAKYYNSMIEEGGNIRIQMKDVERMKYIYGLMSDEQRKNAEPFPNFPKPPPPPPAPEEPKYKVKEVKPPSPPKPVAIEVIEQQKLPPPPPPPTKVAQYKNGKKKTLNEIIKETPKGVESGYELLENGESHYYTVYKGKKTYYNKDGYITNEKGDVLPPPPPAPETPLDFVIRMAKVNTKFYYETEQISSDKAIELLKNSTKLNVRAKNTHTKQPLIYISKKPMVIEVKEKLRN